MRTPIDHLILGGPDLDALEQYAEEQLGVPPRRGGSHPGWGTRNSLVGLGGRRYLELVAPDPAQDDPEGARPFRVDELVAPTLVGWAVRADDIAAVVGRSRESGHDPGDPVAMSRTTPDGALLSWHLTPTDTGFAGALPFVIDWGETPHPSDGLPGVTLQTFRVRHPEASRISSVLEALGAGRGPVQLRTGAPARLSAVLLTAAGRVELG